MGYFMKYTTPQKNLMADNYEDVAGRISESNSHRDQASLILQTIHCSEASNCFCFRNPSGKRLLLSQGRLAPS